MVVRRRPVLHDLGIGADTGMGMTVGRMLFAGLLALVLAFSAPATVGAQSAPQDQYGGPGPAPGQNPGPGSGGEAGRPDEGGPGQPGGGQGGGAGGKGPKAKGGKGKGGKPGAGAAPDRRESGAAPLRDAKGGSLPFTGADLSTLLLLGGLLVMVGATGRAVERRFSQRAR